jgi:hypothetical protein
MLFTSAMGLHGVTLQLILTQKHFCVNANKKGKGLPLAFGLTVIPTHRSV